MKLREWLFMQRMHVTDFAKSIGYNRATVYRWKSGSIIPGSKALELIEEFTEGKVVGIDDLKD